MDYRKEILKRASEIHKMKPGDEFNEALEKERDSAKQRRQKDITLLRKPSLYEDEEIVLRAIHSVNTPSGQEYVVWNHVKSQGEDDGFYRGIYSVSLESAIERFNERGNKTNFTVNDALPSRPEDILNTPIPEDLIGK